MKNTEILTAATTAFENNQALTAAQLAAFRKAVNETSFTVECTRYTFAVNQDEPALHTATTEEKMKERLGYILNDVGCQFGYAVNKHNEHSFVYLVNALAAKDNDTVEQYNREYNAMKEKAIAENADNTDFQLLLNLANRQTEKILAKMN